MSVERSFRTKTGRCILEDDRIVLERSGARGAMANAVVGSSVSRVLLVYGVLAAVIFALGGRAVVSGDWMLAAFDLALALYLVRGIMRSRGLSAAPVLARAAVTAIDGHPPTRLVTRGHFVVHFDDGGKPRRRLIILPGVVEGGDAEFNRAVELLRSEGLPVTRR